MLQKKQKVAALHIVDASMSALRSLNAAVHARNWELIDKLLDDGAPVNMALDGVRPCGVNP